MWIKQWTSAMGNAHNWIIDHWQELKDGDVVDVQFILGETKEPKVSERLVHAWHSIET